jgi:hypothetical protein
MKTLRACGWPVYFFFLDKSQKIRDNPPLSRKALSGVVITQEGCGPSIPLGT